MPDRRGSIPMTELLELRMQGVKIEEATSWLEKISGRIEVSPNAIASLASQAVLECYGVVGMASPNFVNGLAQLLRRLRLALVALRRGRVDDEDAANARQVRR